MFQLNRRPSRRRTIRMACRPEPQSVSTRRPQEASPRLPGCARVAAVFFLCLLASPAAMAQADANAHMWLQYFGDHPLVSTRWGVRLEAQFRRHDVLRAPHNLLLRPALDFRLHPDREITAGYGYVSHHRSGAYPAARSWDEHRLFQDVKLHHAANRARLLHRFRFENRWLVNGLYENRFRYMARTKIPLHGPWYLAAWNEAFAPVKPEQFPRFLERNRATLAVGKRVTDHVRVETGYMLQTVWQRNGRIREDNHTVVFALSGTAPLFGKR